MFPVTGVKISLVALTAKASYGRKEVTSLPVHPPLLLGAQDKSATAQKLPTPNIILVRKNPTCTNGGPDTMAMVAATYIGEDRVEKVAIVVKVRPLQYLLARGSNLDLEVKKFRTDFQNFLAKISVITLYQYYTGIPFYCVECKNQTMAGYNARGDIAPDSMGNSEFCVGDPETCAMCTVFCVPYTGNFCPFLTQC